MRDLLIAKTKASGVHLGISAIIFVGILYLIVVQWYPEPFFFAEGGWKGLKIMAFVDLVLGPVLTFIIFNHLKPKKEIIFDLTIVAAIQISALVWGGVNVYAERPVALVMWENKFYTVTEDYYHLQGLSVQDLTGYSDDKPLIILADTKHSVKRLEELQRLNEQKIPPYAQVHLYQMLDEKSNVKSQLSDEVLALFGVDYKLEDGELAFDGKAKYKNLIVVLSSNLKLKKVIALE